MQSPRGQSAPNTLSGADVLVANAPPLSPFGSFACTQLPPPKGHGSLTHSHSAFYTSCPRSAPAARNSIDSVLTYIQKQFDPKVGGKDPAMRAATLAILRHIINRMGMSAVPQVRRGNGLGYVL